MNEILEKLAESLVERFSEMRIYDKVQVKKIMISHLAIGYQELMEVAKNDIDEKLKTELQNLATTYGTREQVFVQNKITKLRLQKKAYSNQKVEIDRIIKQNRLERKHKLLLQVIFEKYGKEEMELVKKLLAEKIENDKIV